MQPDQLPDAAKRSLSATRWAIAAERAARAFWPLASLIFAAAALLLSGVLTFIPVGPGQGLLIGLGLGSLVALVLGLRRFRLPTGAEAAARLDATLPGRPLAALADSQAVGVEDPASRAVWEAHRTRMAEKLHAARPVPPNPGLAGRDPFALRLIALTALVAAFFFGARTTSGDLAALLPGAGPVPVAEASWEGWIEPPGYTGKPTLYLADQPPGRLEVPAGSRVTLRLYGRVGALSVEDSWSGAEPEALERAFAVDRDGILSIGDDAWQIVALPDRHPEVRPEGDLGRDLDGRMNLPFAARDDYGVTGGQARLVLDLPRVPRRYGLAAEPEPRPEIVVDLPMPYRGERTEIHESLGENLAEHPWAGLPVLLTLSVSDAAGQQSDSAPMEIVLPGRRFLDPLAQALIEMRRDILWSQTNVSRSARILRAVSDRPEEGLFPRSGQYLKLRRAIRQLEAGVDATGRDEVAQALWDIAVEIEDGALDDALERLRRAQERLSEAMRQGASPQELSQLMDEYRQASRDYMRQLAQQGGQPQQQAEGQSMEMSQADLQAMMDRIEELMREGRTAEAEQMLQMLQQMMENMELAEGGGQQGEGQQAMDGLRDTLREQQGLSDEAFRNLQERQGQGEQGQQGGSDDEALAQRQRELEGELDSQRRNLPGAGTDEGEAARDSLDHAGRAMDEAAEALEQGDTSGALDRQAEAMEALREGMRNLGAAMRQAQAGEPGEQGSQGARPGERNRTDPLGRNPGGAGAAATDDPLAEGEDVYRRAQELMDELRRRAGEPDRPEVERDYLKRLLDLF